MEISTAIIHWLLQPISGSSIHAIAAQVSWHGRLMVIAWSVLIPLGVLVARFYKVTPKQNFPVVVDNPFWWHSHRGFQYLGFCLMLIGLAFVASLKPMHWHKTLGYIVATLGVLQVMSAYWRGTKGGPTDTQIRGDHYDMTKRRLIFESFHKTLGYVALLLVPITTFSGLSAADAPRWMWLAIGIWWLALLVVFVVLQKQGRNVDTYTAIWGKPFS